MPLMFDYRETSLIDPEELSSYMSVLRSEIERIEQALNQSYSTPYASINLVFDEDMILRIQEVIKQKSMLRPSVLIVIGIGGSCLATQAIYQSIFGTLYNEHDPDIKLYFADTVDSDYLWDIVLLLEQQFEMGKDVLVHVVSKSGTTLETVVNFKLFLSVLKKRYDDRYRDYIVVTTDEKSPLWHWAHQEHITTLTIPKNVGGRYSAFSAVALFPLGMIGIDIEQLCSGARSALASAISVLWEDNIAAQRALLMYNYYQKNVLIHDLFLFSTDMHDIGSWYRQLVAESLGKDGKGIMPTVSLGTVDLHSMIQLYFGGPEHQRFTTFVHVKKNKSNLVISEHKGIDQLSAYLPSLPVHAVMEAIFDGVCSAYVKKGLPFCTLTLPEKSAFYMGQLLQTMMIEVIYLGFLLKVNPFDQPQVELYKEEVRKFLAERTI